MKSGQKNYFAVNKRVYEDMSDAYKENFGETTAQTMSCYIGYDINHLTLTGDQLGFEKFGPPYDFFRRAKLVKDEDNNYRILFNMKFGDSNIFLSEMRDLQV
jgi:hypothetical protein